MKSSVGGGSSSIEKVTVSISGSPSPASSGVVYFSDGEIVTVQNVLSNPVVQNGYEFKADKLTPFCVLSPSQYKGSVESGQAVTIGSTSDRSLYAYIAIGDCTVYTHAD